MTTDDFQLTRNAHGRLMLTTRDLSSTEVVPVRAFPIAAPEEGVALVNGEGHEMVWIAHLGDLAPAVRVLVEEELANREFVPEIRRLVGVSSFATPSTWTVETDRGDATLVLKGEEDIRRLGASTLLVADSHGIQFMIRNLAALDRHSRKLLDRFL